MLRTLWKPHESKDYNFLHRNYDPTFFFSSEYIFFAIEKQKLKILWFFFQKWKKSMFFNEKSYDFSLKNIDFFTFENNSQKFQFLFFDREKNNIFSELKKKLGHSFDVENCNLSIYEVFRAFWAWQRYENLGWLKNLIIWLVLFLIHIKMEPTSDFHSRWVQNTLPCGNTPRVEVGWNIHQTWWTVFEKRFLKLLVDDVFLKECIETLKIEDISSPEPFFRGGGGGADLWDFYWSRPLEKCWGGIVRGLNNLFMICLVIMMIGVR